MNDVKTTLKFSFNLKASLLVMILMPVTLALGFWQLDRANEKQVLKVLFEQRKNQPAKSITEFSRSEDLRYQPVLLQGEFIEEKWMMLDNKINRGRFGYEIIQLFKPKESDFFVLVNRGWIEGDRSRRSVPVIAHVDGYLELSGEIYVPHGALLTLSSVSSLGWKNVVQVEDIDFLSKELQQDIFPFVVRINTDSKAAYEPNWILVNIQPNKHIAYAFQWFSMALALFIIALLSNTNIWMLLKRQQNNLS